MGDSAWGSGGGTYQVVVVVGRCAREMRGGEGDWARRVEWRWGKVRGGGTVARTRRWWWWGRAFAIHEGGSGFGPEN